MEIKTCTLEYFQNDDSLMDLMQAFLYVYTHVPIGTVIPELVDTIVTHVAYKVYTSSTDYDAQLLGNIDKYIMHDEPR